MNTIEIICTLIAAIATILGGVWYIIGKAVDKGVDKNRLNVLENKVQTADCEGHKNSIETTSALINKTSADMVEIKNDLSLIKAYLVGESSKASRIFSVKCSPRKLNKNGECLFEQINGKDFLNRHSVFLFSKIDLRKPTTALDVEIYANEVCLESVDDPIFKELKDFVYKAPSINITNEQGVEQSYDVSMNDVCFVLSIPLRNMYLESHKEINPTE